MRPPSEHGAHFPELCPQTLEPENAKKDAPEGASLNFDASNIGVD
jgi:hypothetical protein